MSLVNFINTLKELDESIDFAKGVYQWKIVLILFIKGPMSTSEIAKEIGVNKKSVIDSIRKLIDKGLVERVKYDIYTLSENGKKLMEKLSGISTQQLQVIDLDPTEDILNNVTHYYYFVEIVKASTLNNYKVPINSLCRELGVSKRTLINYLDIFSTKYKYFKKITKKGLFRNKVEYMLTDEGKKIAYKIPGTYKLRRNTFLKILTKVTLSNSLEYSIFKILVSFSITAPLIFMLSKYPEDKIVAAIWLYFLVFFGVSSVLAYLLSK
ncbi:ArsR family transcriptional regulator [Acidianus sp. HS-5]|uniref:helix-turn-helix domain-containing protein n=1 Tax=Acidianus sp. HS-5 TaxID=2886040 RepID=UPI001EFF8B7B|nr:ArsR family transcriptional regulator [Acidianus sp. HS-5]BDC17326.1 MarR family transcriptional regulator [Acidianus sp. HS-5]